MLWKLPSPTQPGKLGRGDALTKAPTEAPSAPCVQHQPRFALSPFSNPELPRDRALLAKLGLEAVAPAE